MEYTIKKLAEMAGVSARTLRYYDEIGLLKPSRISSSGYRIYSEKEVDLLQRIMFYRTLDFKLEDIEKLLYNPKFDETKELERHLQQLTQKVKDLTAVIHTVEKTIAYKKGEINMTDKEKFEGLKKETIEKNESKYGKEIRDKYGKDTVEASNAKYMNMSEEEFGEMTKTEEEMFRLLIDVTKTGELESAEAKMVYQLHKKWLGFTWNFYSSEAHKGVAQMYVADERFTSYYEMKACAGATKTLHDIIEKYAK